MRTSISRLKRIEKASGNDEPVFEVLYSGGSTEFLTALELYLAVVCEKPIVDYRLMSGRPNAALPMYTSIGLDAYKTDWENG